MHYYCLACCRLHDCPVCSTAAIARHASFAQITCNVVSPTLLVQLCLVHSLSLSVRTNCSHFECWATSTCESIDAATALHRSNWNEWVWNNLTSSSTSQSTFCCYFATPSDTRTPKKPASAARICRRHVSGLFVCAERRQRRQNWRDRCSTTLC